jgi:N-acetylglucosaminyldiphosphoundecaprenol N-acetyl-beta-D-mannosaminyltransferase
MDYTSNLYSGVFLLVALLSTHLLTPHAMRLARWLGAVDVGGYRKQYRGEIPLLGGLAVAIPFILVCLYLALDKALALEQRPSYCLSLAVACSAMALLGAADDIYNLRAKTKLIWQVLIALLLCGYGHAIPRLAIPFVGTLELSGMTSVIVTVVWLVALTNAFNLIDGVDGLAAGLGLVSALGFAALAAVMGNVFVVFLSLALAGSLIAFLRYNISPARIFLGDTGSMFLGFSLAGIGLLGGHRSQATLLIGAPILILGLPIIETLISMARRFLYGHPVFFGDSRHTHHRLGGRGFSPRQTVVMLCSVGVVLSCAGVMNQVIPPGTQLALLPYVLYGVVLVAIGTFAGYVINPRKLIGSFARRGRNSLLNSLSKYGSEALSLNQGHEFLSDTLQMFRRHSGLRFIDVSLENTKPHLGSSGVEDVEPSETKEPVELLRVSLPDSRVVLVRYQFDLTPDADEREDVVSALAKMFQQARLRVGTGRIQEKSNILGIGCNMTNYQKVVETIEAWRSGQSRKSRYVVAINPHSVMMGKRNRNVRRAMAGAALSLPDGIGMVWAANILGYSHRGRVTGPTLLLNLCDSGRDYGFRHYFYGGAPGVAEEMVARLTAEFPGLEVAGTGCPPFRPLTPEEDSAAVAEINASRADILWVGLGSPKQESWMASHADSVQVPIMVGVGAAFDFHSGNIKWAPRWIRSIGLEWVYRLVQEPRRLWRRNLDSPLFLFHVLLQKLRPPAFREFDRSTRSAAAEASQLGLEPVQEHDHVNVIVFGIGQHSALFLREYDSLPSDHDRRRRVVGLLAQGRASKPGLRVHGYPVLGDVNSLPSLLANGNVSEVVVAEAIDPALLETLLATCREHGVRVSQWIADIKPLAEPFV